MCLPSSTGNGIGWCLTIIHHQAINSKRRYIRWNRDVLTMNRMYDGEVEWGERIPCSSSAADMSESDLILWLLTLPYLQYEVLRGIYVLGSSQSELANRLNISQQHVSRLKEKGLAKLREELIVLCVT